MKHMLLFSLMIASAASIMAKDVTGRVHSNGQGLPGVVVTDGTNFTITDKDGAYAMSAQDDADFIYIVTPSGYVASYADGTPAFYKPLGAKSLDFDLFEYSVPGGSYALFAVGDTQPGSEHAYKRLETEAFPELKQYGEKYKQRHIPVTAIMLGDMVWDNPETYGRYKEGLKKLGYPVYPLIGNHDHDETCSDNYKSEAVYRANFGPTYYAFNLGQDYYIMLDNIDYHGNRQYDTRLDDKQLEWVERYTQYIPKGARVFVAMHAPAYTYTSDEKLPGADRLMDILADYEVHILSGHTHIHSNIALRPNVREHMVASIGGAWWLWDSQYCMDGTPMGYQVFESSPRSGLRWHFKTTGRDRDYQFRVYPIGTVPEHCDELCVKVWNWDEGWKVEWIEDGVKKGEMKQFGSFDPDYKQYLEDEFAQGRKRITWRFPVRNGFSFFSAKPSPKAKTVTVIVTDRFGQEYRQNCELF